MSYTRINLPGGPSSAAIYPDSGSFPASGSPGQLIVAQDTGIIYYYDPIAMAWVPTSGGGGGSTDPYKPEFLITLNSTDITNQYVVLTEAPTIKAKTRLSVGGGIEQIYGVDFVVTVDDSNKRLSWSGLGLQSLLVSGDILIVEYN